MFSLLRKPFVSAMSIFLFVCALAPLTGSLVYAQSDTATVDGRVTDPHGLAVPGAKVEVVNIDTKVSYTAETNGSGLYSVSGLPVGTYRVIVTKDGFVQMVKPGVQLHVQDVAALNFQLQVGSVTQSVTVEAGGIVINTTDASVSTIVDRQFVDNIPLNGRSFQDLETLAPGVVQVTMPYFTGYSGEIVVNGQRSEANYFTVDGVSVNTGTYASNLTIGAGFSGGLPGETVLGTTQSMVSIDAMQEFRATTSGYSAEYGRSPGGQFSFSTRSGTNTWHGSAFDYFRNDVLDANNWFSDANGAAKPAERQNDFGGTLGGPVVIPKLYDGKDRTFFFFSYEGLRLTVPQPYEQFKVPDAALRANAPTAIQPGLNAFPLPNGGEDGLNDGLGWYHLVYSSPSYVDNVGIRVDHSFGDKLKIFGRYANTPSNTWNYTPFEVTKDATNINVRTVTLGATSTLSPTQANDFRFNFTKNYMSVGWTSPNLGGATPLDLSFFNGPGGQSLPTLGSGGLMWLSYGGPYGISPILYWSLTSNDQHQFNITDTYSWSRGPHQLKFGVDWRRLTTYIIPTENFQGYYYYSEASVLNNSADLGLLIDVLPAEPVFWNLGAYAQDEWKVNGRLSLSLGLRWDVNPPPGNLIGPKPYTLNQITDIDTAVVSPTNTPQWKTDWHGFAPRIGVAYQFRDTPGHETVLRTGFGVFYDMGNTLAVTGFNDSIGFSTFTYYTATPFPMSSAQATPPPTSVAPPYNAAVVAFDPNLVMPYSLQWNVTVEQGLGSKQTLTVGYVASVGRDLLSTFQYAPTTPAYAGGNGVTVTNNAASSNYNSLQAKYQRNLSRGLQVVASYTWSHSIDDSSTNFTQIDRLLRASSDFDIRHNFQAAITYDVPGHYSNAFSSAVLEHWGLDSRISARSAPPIDVIATSSTINPLT
jgi:hypothetical protein